MGMRMDFADKARYVKEQLRKKACIGTQTLAKMGRGEDANTGVLRKICAALACTLPYIPEIVPDEQKELPEEG